nr:hypothetical protein [Brevibacillus laterosporus]
MENKLVKSAKYGFLVGLAIMILFVPEKREIHLFSGGFATQELSWMEYILRVARYTIIFTIAVVLMTFLQEKRGLQAFLSCPCSLNPNPCTTMYDNLRAPDDLF